MLRASLRTKLLLALVILFLPVLALLLLDFQITYRGRVESALDGLASSGNFLASFVDSSFDEGISLAQSYALDPAVQRLNAETIYPFLVSQSKLFPQYDDIAVVDTTGQGVVSARIPLGQQTVNVADRDYFKQAMATNRPVIANLLTSRATGNPIIVTAAPIPGSDGRPIGVVITSLSPGFLAQRIAEVPLPEHQTVFVIDPTGTIAVHRGTPASGLQGQNVADYPPVAAALQGKEFRGSVSKSLTGDERVVVSVRTPRYGWAVGASLPTSDVRAANLGPVLMRLAIYLIVAAAVALAAFALAQRLVVSPLSTLARRLVAFGRGDLHQRAEIRTGDELEAVAQAFNRMAEEIRAREEQLRESEERFRLIVTNSPDNIFYQDRELRYTWMANPPAPLDEPQVLGKTDFDLFAREEAEQLTKIKKKVLETGIGTRVEARLVLAGVERYYDVAYEPRREQEGRIVGLFGYARDITQRKRIEELREEYIHTITHDLRAPLTIIQGQAQAVQRTLQRSGLNGMAGRGVDAIVTSAKRMNAMIQDLVDAARIESDQLTVNAKPVDIRGFLIDLKERMAEVAGAERVLVEVPEGLPLVLADPDRLERIISNLLANALKYSAPDTQVVVTATQGEGQVVTAVADRGQGIPPEMLSHLFERYYRTSLARESKEGLGLGLYITKGLVEAHGGCIWVESEVGKGSTFYFSLPFV